MGITKFFANRMFKKWEKSDNEILSAQTFPDGIESICDIFYCPNGHEKQKLDVYFPKNAAKPLPVIVNIHGGGFLAGDKKTEKLFCYHLANRGFVVFNLNYRLAMNDTKVPGQIKDVAYAFDWIEKNIKKYPADKNSIYISSDSAGSVLAVMVALCLKSARLRQIYDAPSGLLSIKSIGIISGMMSFDKSGFFYGGMRRLSFDKGYKKTETYQNMRFANLPEIKELPPIFLATSDEDELQFMTYDFEKVLQKYNVLYKIQNYKKVKDKRLGHIFPVMRPSLDESKDLINKMLAFFKMASEK